MAGGSSIIRWESDPLFSAAEVVQDSADRMESLYRLLMHDWKLACEENKDNKLLSSIHYHKRDLVTAVETTKWQLEDFERAVYFAALSDETGLRKNAISKHKQFIDAIREQIVSVEKCLEGISIGDSDRSMQWTHLNQPDFTDLALFLSGNDSMDHHLQHNSENTIMKRFFDSTGTTDEIIELEPEEHLRVNDMGHLNQASNFSKDDKPWECGSKHMEGHDLKSSCFPQEGVRENGYMTSDNVEAQNANIGKTNSQYLLSTNRLIRHFPRPPSSFWFLNKFRFSRNFTKRRKDGEITGDLLVHIDGHSDSENVSSAKQCKQAFSFDVCHGLNYRGLSGTMQVGKWLESLPRRFNQSQGLSRHMTHMRSAFVVLTTITIIGTPASDTTQPFASGDLESPGTIVFSEAGGSASACLSYGTVPLYDIVEEDDDAPEVSSRPC